MRGYRRETAENAEVRGKLCMEKVHVPIALENAAPMNAWEGVGRARFLPRKKTRRNSWYSSIVRAGLMQRIAVTEKPLECMPVSDSLRERYNCAYRSRTQIFLAHGKVS